MTSDSHSNSGATGPPKCCVTSSFWSLNSARMTGRERFFQVLGESVVGSMSQSLDLFVVGTCSELAGA
jgi:hypothetical protein